MKSCKYHICIKQYWKKYAMMLIQSTESTAITLSGIQKHKYIISFIILGVCSNVLWVFCFIELTYKLTYPSTAESHSLLYLLNLCVGKYRNKKLLQMFYLPVLLLGGNGNNCSSPSFCTSKGTFRDFHFTSISWTHTYLFQPQSSDLLRDAAY